MIAKHVPMRSLGKSDFAGLTNYITDAQSKDHRLGQVLLTNCSAATLSAAIEEVLATQHFNTRAKSDKTYHLIVSFRVGEQPSAHTLKAIEELKTLSVVRVLIAEEPCPLFARRTLGKKRVQVAYVDGDCASAAAEGSCGDCLNTLACPAFYVEDGKMAIDPLLCSGCMLCLQFCKNIKARKGDAK